MSVATVSSSLLPAHRVLRYQASASAAVSGLAAVFAGPGAAAAAGYGGVIAIVLGWRLARGLGAALGSETVAMQSVIYFGVIQRLLFAGAAFGLGLRLLRLSPPPLLAAFGLCQTAYLFPRES